MPDQIMHANQATNLAYILKSALKRRILRKENIALYREIRQMERLLEMEER